MSEPLLIKYRDINFRPEKLAMVRVIAQICDEYRTKGHVLTVRQIYYQLVAHHGLENRGRAYDQVQGAVNDGRLAGLIPWDAVEDRGRDLRGVRTYDDPADAVAQLRRQYKADLWANQPMRPEVWIEKQALEGVLQRICARLRVDFYATKGYDSQSQSWRAGRRFADRVRRGQRPVIIYLGDHDPSGLDMTRDVHERVSEFAGFRVPVERVALNRDQIEEYALPENPDNRPKPGDSRTAAYVAEHGDMGWELDALDPDVIEAAVERAVARVRDDRLWEMALAEEVTDREELARVERELGGRGEDESESESESEEEDDGDGE